MSKQTTPERAYLVINHEGPEPNYYVTSNYSDAFGRCISDLNRVRKRMGLPPKTGLGLRCPSVFFDGEGQAAVEIRVISLCQVTDGE